MTIINKEGNVYLISGPNKLVENQVAWDSKKLIFHNFNWKDELFKNQSRPQSPVGINKIAPQPTEPIFHVEQEKDPEINLKNNEKENEFSKENKDDATQKTEKQDFELPFIRYKALMHCLPAENKKYSDNFYGEKWSKTFYKKKFIFPAVIISNQDLSMEFWSTDPDNKITENSIVFPFAYEIYNEDTQQYDRVPFDEHRWWLVSSKEVKESGWLFSTVPSSTQPDFSD